VATGRLMVKIASVGPSTRVTVDRGQFENKCVREQQHLQVGLVLSSPFVSVALPGEIW
jgi:hypothetical protein